MQKKGRAVLPEGLDGFLSGCSSLRGAHKMVVQPPVLTLALKIEN